MRLKPRHIALLGLLPLCTAFMGCQSAAQQAIANSEMYDGTVVAQGQLVGQKNGVSNAGTPSDCDGQSVGVKVTGATADNHYLFDKNGQPCQAADVLFDGSNPINQRAPEPGVQINFHDRFGPRPDNADAQTQLPPLTPLVTAIGNKNAASPEALAGAGVPKPAQNPDVMPKDVARMADSLRKGGPATATSGATGGPSDALSQVIGDWKSADARNRLLQESEQIMADARSANRIASMDELQKQQDKILQLTALLREAQHQAMTEQQQHNMAVEKAQQSQAQLDATRAQSDQQTTTMRTQIEALQQRIKEFDRYNKRLEQQHETLQQAYQAKIAELSADLKASQTQADANRQAAILQAAQQISDAQRLALAAKVSQRKALEQQALELQKEAEALSQKANNLPDKLPDNMSPNGVDPAYKKMAKNLVADKDMQNLARIVVDGRNATDSLQTAKITLHEENTPLGDIFTHILKDVEPYLGEWQISWQLSPQNLNLKNEKWTVAAETSFNDFVSYVVQKVQQAHGVRLKFQVFGDNHLIVVSEDKPARGA